MFGRKRDPEPTPPTPTPPGTVRDPEAVEDETPGPEASDEERYW